MTIILTVYIFSIWINTERKKANEKITQKKNEIAAQIIFGDIIRELENRKQHIKSMDSYGFKTFRPEVDVEKPKSYKIAVDHRKVGKELEKLGTMKPLTNWFKPKSMQ